MVIQIKIYFIEMIIEIFKDETVDVTKYHLWIARWLLVDGLDKCLVLK